MDNIVEQVFNKLMRGSYQRRVTGFTKNISLMGTTPVPDDVKAHGMHLANARHAGGGNSLMGNRPWPSFIHEAQLKYIARDLFCYYFPPDSPNASILTRIAFTKLNKTRYEKLRKKVKTSFVTQTLASFYKRDEKVNWWNVFAELPTWCVSVDDEIKVIYRIALSIIDAMSMPAMKTLPMEFRTNTVMAILKQMRKTGDTSPFPILADALEDANITKTVSGELLVNRYRNPDMVHTLGSWVFKTTGNLEYTGGSPNEGKTDDPVGE